MNETPRECALVQLQALRSRLVRDLFVDEARGRDTAARRLRRVDALIRRYGGKPEAVQQ